MGGIARIDLNLEKVESYLGRKVERRETWCISQGHRDVSKHYKITYLMKVHKNNNKRSGATSPIGIRLLQNDSFQFTHLKLQAHIKQELKLSNIKHQLSKTY